MQTRHWSYKIQPIDLVYGQGMGVSNVSLTHWGRDKIDAVSQTTFSNAFSLIEMCEFRLRLLKFLPKGPINNIAALVQIMAWRRPGDNPSYELIKVSLSTHICVTRPQWVKVIGCDTLWLEYNVTAAHDLAYLCRFRSRACFLSFARGKLRRCSSYHRPGYWSNLPVIGRAYSQ